MTICHTSSVLMTFVCANKLNLCKVQMKVYFESFCIVIISLAMLMHVFSCTSESVRSLQCQHRLMKHLQFCKLNQCFTTTIQMKVFLGKYLTIYICMLVMCLYYTTSHLWDWLIYSVSDS